MAPYANRLDHHVTWHILKQSCSWRRWGLPRILRLMVAMEQSGEVDARGIVAK